MKQPRKHADLIKAWADGAEIQVRGFWNGEHTWHNIETPTFVSHQEYRIKPEQKPDVVKYIVFDGQNYLCTAKCIQFKFENGKWPQVKVTFDGETGKLKSAEVIS